MGRASKFCHRFFLEAATTKIRPQLRPSLSIHINRKAAEVTLRKYRCQTWGTLVMGQLAELRRPRPGPGTAESVTTIRTASSQQLHFRYIHFLKWRRVCSPAWPAQPPHQLGLQTESKKNKRLGWSPNNFYSLLVFLLPVRIVWIKIVWLL